MKSNKPRWTTIKSLLRKALRSVIYGDREAAGINGISPTVFRSKDGLSKALSISRSLLDKINGGGYSYTPCVPGHVYGLDGNIKRTHAIPEFWDSVVLKTLQLEVRPHWSDIPPEIVGGRPDTQIRSTVWSIWWALQRPAGLWVLRFDIKQAFASAEWRQALRILVAKTGRADIAGELERFFLLQEREGFEGLIEGVCVSPFLLALILGEKVVPEISGYGSHCWIYVDDGILLTDSEFMARRAKEQLSSSLDDLGMALHEAPPKTSVEFYEKGAISNFSYLNFEFGAHGPIPSRALQKELLDALQVIDEDEPDAQKAHRLMARTITAFIKFFCFVDDPVFEKIDNSISSQFQRYASSLPKISSGAVRSSKGSSDEPPYPRSSNWLPRETRQFFERRFLSYRKKRVRS